MAEKPRKQANQHKPTKRDDSFESTARRLECDPDLQKFDAQLRRIAKHKPSSGSRSK